jgi:hypothetical protein
MLREDPADAALPWCICYDLDPAERTVRQFSAGFKPATHGFCCGTPDQ